MDRRFKIITIAISIVYVANIGWYIHHEIANVVYGAKLGTRASQSIAETGEFYALSTFGAFFLSLKPDDGFRTFPSTMLNQSDRMPMKAEFEKMVVELSDLKGRLPKGTIAADICSVLLSFLSAFVLFLIPVQTFRVVSSITKNKIFDPANIRKLRSIGYAMLALYVTTFFVNFFHYRIAAHVIHVEGYTLQMDMGNITLVMLGFVVLMFAEVLKVSVHLKEEQDLTV